MSPSLPDRWYLRHHARVGGAVLYVCVLTLAFSRSLSGLALHALRNDLHSHVLLVPFAVGYLLYHQRSLLPIPERGGVFGAAASAAIGATLLLAALRLAGGASHNDQLALQASAFLSFVIAGGCLFLGYRWMSRAAFPAVFLLFMVPLPDACVNWLERGSALASAEAAALYFAVSGIPLVREGTTFELPGIVLEVAQECSGIRSSWALFITSVLGAHLFLKSQWRRLAIIAFVIPLGIMRNGLRIFVIGALCVHVGPQMIDSPIHRQGGPLFFALSLIPLFLALEWLRRQERREGRRPDKS